MADVLLGIGSLAGTGVYAARDFAAGEVVVSYQLMPLDEAGYLALPAGEDLFVHSFGGRRYLYPAPARYVNHSDDPTCSQDFERCCDVALRPIAQGEAITIDARAETARELATFLAAYQEAAQVRSTLMLDALVDADAMAWLSGRAVRGRAAVVTALVDDGSGPLTNIEWLVGTGRWEALCSADAEDSAGGRHVSILLKVVAGNWQLVYLHAG